MTTSPDGVLRRKLAGKIQRFLQAPCGNQDGERDRANIRYEFPALELRLKEVFPLSGTLSGARSFLL